MRLLDYLNSNFPTDKLWSEDVFIERFMTAFGVSVKVENDLYQFKYDMISANWKEDLTRECRGVILRKTANGWIVAARPWDKFFNVHEGHSGIHEAESFNAACGDFEFHEKGDGTAIMVWFDHVKDHWRASTLGTITPANVGDIPDLTFDRLFWNTLEANGFDSRMLGNEEKDYTFLFELCCAENRILTKYPDNRVYLLSIRHNESGEYTKEPSNYAYGLGALVPHKYTFKELGITTLDAAHEWVEGQASDVEKYGEYSEGFCIYKDGAPIAKLKNRDYVDKHHAIGAGDILHTRNVVIERFFNGTLDDLMDVLVDAMKDYSDRLREWWVSNIVAQEAIVTEMRKHSFADQKAFALYLQEKVDGSFKSFYFANKDDVLSGYSLTPLLNDWIKGNWKKFEKEIKAL